MAVITATGDSREAALMRIVASIAYAEGKASSPDTLVFKTGDFSRDWLLSAFAVARQCLDGPHDKAGTAAGAGAAGH